MKLSFIPLLNYDISPGLGAVIGGGSSLLGDIFNLFGQSKANREQEAYNMNIMNTQRQWALQDIANQNAYNSPVQQMQRLKEAGLNPNLVYGEGIQAAGTSDAPRSVPAPSFTPQNTLTGFADLGNQTMSALNTGADVASKVQSIDNMKAQKFNTEADTFIKEKTGNILSTEPGATDQVEYDDQGNMIPAGTVNGKKYYNSVDYNTALKQAVASAKGASSITQAVQEGLQSVLKTTNDQKVIDQITQQIKNLEKDENLKKLDIQAQSWDLNANSPIWQQVITKILGALLSHFTK